MIAYIEGKVSELSPTHVILDCNGLGYDVNITLHTYSAIQNKERCKLHTYLSIKEDSHTLYGFWELREKTIFTQLISVSGVGTSTGRMILSSLTANEIRDAIISENVSLIQSIKGIGPKSAKRLILELKDKMIKSGDEGQTTHATGSREEAISALLMLGFNKGAIDKALASVIKDEGSDLAVEDMIKFALKNL